jgi:hypothetical protein
MTFLHFTFTQSGSYYCAVSFVGGKCWKNTNAFEYRVLMMLAGLVCTDTEIAKFSLYSGILIDHVAIYFDLL